MQWSYLYQQQRARSVYKPCEAPVIAFGYSHGPQIVLQTRGRDVLIGPTMHRSPERQTDPLSRSSSCDRPLREVWASFVQIGRILDDDVKTRGQK